MNLNKSFKLASYKGTFRDYQRHLLKKLEHRLDEKKLNVVTPPGSGKVVLGLELICRIGEPCLILSSTDAMRSYWADNFVSRFLPEDEQASRDEYLSFDLSEPSLITSVTYDTLRAAVSKETVTCGDKTVSFANIDVIRLMQERAIRTIILDEPHHLDNRHADALESFLGVLGGEFRVLSLTSTPPYDLRDEEMDRYLALSGEISEEIHIPELVKGGALCPHQDHVYFNYPTEAESKGIRGYRARVDQAVAEAAALPFMSELGRRISKLYTRKRTDFLYSHHEAVVGMMELLYEYGHRINGNVYAHLKGNKNVTPLTAEAAQNAINLMLESQTLLRDGEKDQLTELFTKHHVMENGRVQLTLTPKVRRTLMASAGKLDSIAAITESEAKCLGERLRMMILTDKPSVAEMKHLGKGSAAGVLNLPCVFETLASRLPEIPAGCLTENGAILPDTAAATLSATDGVTVTPSGVAGYSACEFADQTAKTALTDDLFRKGSIRILIGSAEDMGMGWDGSFVNTMIDAAPNCSFTENNRIRGRVIHADKNDPAKAAHIWHLVTMEHSYTPGENNELLLASRLTSDADGGLATDFRNLLRRFECYMGPNAETGELENGIERLGMKTIAHHDSVEGINAAMLERAAARDTLPSVWMHAMLDTTKPISEVRVPKTAKVPVFTPKNVLLVLGSLLGVFGGFSAATFFIKALIVYLFFNNGAVVTAAVTAVIIMLATTLAIIAVSFIFIIYFLPLPISHLTASSSVRSLCRNLLKTLKDVGAVNKEAVMVMETLPDKSGYRLYIDNCHHDEQIIFQKSVAEMLSPIHSARYIAVRGGWFGQLLWRWSFTCPTVIAKNDVYVKVFEKHLRRSMGSMKFQYTRRDPGRKHLIFARNKAYLNTRGKSCEKRIHLLKNERVL